MSARILVFTGPGAGKTSAALGKVLRLVGHGRRVAVLQFLKRDTGSGEIAALARLGVAVEPCGLGFVPPGGRAQESHHAAAQAGMARAQALLATHDALVLDEVCGAVVLGLVDEAQLLTLLATLRDDQVCICTGFGAPPALLAVADTVSELACVKHALQRGVAAMAGIER